NNMKKLAKAFIAVCLCLAIVVGFIPAMPPAVTAEAAATTIAAPYGSYTSVNLVPTQSGCPAMQGMDVDNTYLYCAKINTTTETSATIARIHKDTAEITWLKNSATGTIYFSQLAHANDLAVTTVNGVKTMFVATGGAGKGPYSLVRLAFNGTTLTEVAHYNVKLNGTETYLAGVKVMSVNDSEVELLLKSGNKMFTATVGANQASSDVALTSLCTLDFSAVNFGGTVKDISDFIIQGFGYYDNKIFVPMSGNNDTGNTNNVSVIVCFDINGASGTIKNDPSMSVWITDSTYLDLFEIESCAICPSDGKLYFATNRRQTSSDGASDGVHYVKNYIYNPSAGDSSDSSNYRWEIGDGVLKSVTDGGAMYNHPIQHLGSISGSTITGGRFSLDQTVYLNHDQPWVIEWKSSSWTSNSMLLSTYSISGYEGNRFLFRRNNSDLIAIGERSGNQYNNYGIKLSDCGVDGSKTHVYRLENRINDDGSNMVYLLVDGNELGAMNNYYIATTAQGTTSNWLSGKDFAFSYMGTPQHPMSCTMEYMQIWDRGILSQEDEPSIYRWETQSDTFTNVEQFGLTSNVTTKLSGSCTNGVFTGAHFSIEEEMVLLHDRPWSVEWKSEGSGSSRFISTYGSSRLTPYVVNGNLIGIGYWDGAQYNNYGVKLSDYGINYELSHVYRMTNKVSADGTNMVYLSVDGVELGAMNNLYYGGTFQRTDANWISGKDFTFGYVGTFQHPITNFTVDYLQVWENGIPAEHESTNYRWETQSNTLATITNGFTQNTASQLEGSISGGIYSDSFFRLEKSVVLLHDKTWSVEWQSEGDWKDTSNGAMLLSGSEYSNALHSPYLYRRNGSNIIALGERADGYHQNYGIKLSDYGIDGTAAHVYRLENRINSDGINMVYLLVDGVELGAMNNHYQGSTATGTTSNWVSGKDFVFNYIGNSGFSVGNCSIGYLQINEGCVHKFGPWLSSGTSCTTDGSRSRTCSICGFVETEVVSATGHSYKSVTTAPTCTTGGYTTYTCSICGDTYKGDTVPATGHSYISVVTNPTCTTEGYTTYTCSTCGYSYTSDATAATGHSYTAVVTAPTCTTSGYTTNTCACGHSYTSNQQSALGHNYTAKVTKPTCVEAGFTT
ncbi:MAG: hypothetical protein IJB11_01660, partial [Oscillospiraceae bacterium]|nr:hypothetical protein [Oscillospiraceae bacterium]